MNIYIYIYILRRYVYRKDKRKNMEHSVFDNILSKIQWIPECEEIFFYIKI